MSSGILKSIEHNVSETGFIYVFRGDTEINLPFWVR
jgi:hypothetical protein